MSGINTSDEYRQLVRSLKDRVQQARLRASSAVNQELVLLYWNIGREIRGRQAELGWGAKVIDHLASDLRASFPNMKGLSARNLKYMRAFAEAWPDEEFVQQAVAQIPWGHNVRLLDKVSNPDARRFYIAKTREHGWSRSVLELQIESGLYDRQGAAVSNFGRTLPDPQSDLVQEITKDPYCFEFLTLAEDARERDLERGLVDHIRDFLLELGAGFSFVGSQVHLEVADEDFYLDMLFYHLKLRCYVVVELKAGGFKPEYAGKLNFYLSVVDDLMRHPSDEPTIGLLLCKSKNDLLVEYALRDMSKPIGVAGWETQLMETLPDAFKGSLPTVEELEAELVGTAEGNSDNA